MVTSRVFKNFKASTLVYNCHCLCQIIQINRKVPVRFAGHSHWQNVKGTKQAKDIEKSRMYNKFISQMRGAVMAANGQANPEVNVKLREVIESAKKSNMAVATINNVLKKLQNVDIKPFWFELKGPNQMLALACFYGDRRFSIQGPLYIALKKTCLTIAKQPIIHAFDHKGSIVVEAPANIEDPIGKCLEDAIELGAEEVEPCENTDPQQYEFTCSIDLLNVIESKLKKKDYRVILAEENFIPKYTVELDEKEMEEVKEAYAKLEEMHQFERIIDNIA